LRRSDFRMLRPWAMRLNDRLEGSGALDWRLEVGKLQKELRSSRNDQYRSGGISAKGEIDMVAGIPKKFKLTRYL
jgi:hypothetical protein